jgi:hypothetical protein
MAYEFNDDDTEAATGWVILGVIAFFVVVGIIAVAGIFFGVFGK